MADLTKMRDWIIEATILLDDLDPQTLSAEEQDQIDSLTRRALALVSDE